MSTVLRFDGFEVDLAAGRLFKHGSRIRLREQSFRVLAVLLERPGEVVTRDDLRRQLWPTEVFIDFENGLNAAVARLREALGESAEHPRFIETLPKRGYRFIGTISDAVPSPGPAGPATKRLLVLPFVNLTGDAAQEYVCDALTDEVITELAALTSDALAVIARTTAMRYKGARKDASRIGRELRLDYLVEGAVRRTGAAVTVNAQLVRASDEAHVWAKRYDSPPGDVFTTPGPIALAIASALGVGHPLGRGAVGRAGSERKISHDEAAWNEYVEGRRLLDRMHGIFMEYERTRAHFEKAIALDPGFALAHEALAQLYWYAGYSGTMPPTDAFAAGILHAVRASEIDSTRAEARAFVAQYYKQLDYAWPDIQRELARALELNPASSTARMLYAVSWLMPQGRLVEAIAELERALEWDPLSYQLHYWLAITLSLAREADRVVNQARLMIELEPAGPLGEWLLGVALSRKGLIDEALAALRKAVDLSEGAPMMLGWLGLILGVTGRTDEARGVLGRLEEMSRTRYVSPSMFAFVYLGLREVDRAFEWLDRAVEVRDQFMMPIKSYVFFDPIRADPRFHALLRKMKLDA